MVPQCPTNVPVEEVLKVTQERFCEDETLEERTALEPEQVTHLLELCLRSTFFSFRGEFYQQKDGAAMGFPVSPVVANIYMGMFEDPALKTASHAPRIWKGYVDDTFCIMEAEHVDLFLGHINSLRPTIRAAEGGEPPLVGHTPNVGKGGKDRHWRM